MSTCELCGRAVMLLMLTAKAVNFSGWPMLDCAAMGTLTRAARHAAANVFIMSVRTSDSCGRSGASRSPVADARQCTGMSDNPAADVISAWHLGLCRLRAARHPAHLAAGAPSGPLLA